MRGKRETFEILPAILDALKNCKPDIFFGPIKRRASHIAPHEGLLWIFDIVSRKGFEYPTASEMGCRKKKEAEELRRWLYDELLARQFAPALCSTDTHIAMAVRHTWPELALIKTPTPATVQ